MIYLAVVKRRFRRQIKGGMYCEKRHPIFDFCFFNHFLQFFRCPTRCPTEDWEFNFVLGICPAREYFKFVICCWMLPTGLRALSCRSKLDVRNLPIYVQVWVEQTFFKFFFGIKSYLLRIRPNHTAGKQWWYLRSELELQFCRLSRRDWWTENSKID